MPDVTVLFGTQTALNRPLPPNTVLIVPSSDSWNDFGLHSRVDVRMRLGEDAKEHHAFSFIGFLTNTPSEPNGISPLNDLLKGAEQLTIPATDSHRFFTMLPDMESYRAIVRAFGSQHAFVALKAMKDLVALRATAPRPNWLDLATRTRVFQVSFMRNTESYFAFKNAASVLRELEFEETRELSRSLRITFALAGRPDSHDLTFDFDHDGTLPKRIAVVIGKNGVGKSQTLGRIAKAALGGHKSLRDGDSGERPLFNRVLAFAPSNEAHSVFPTEQWQRPRVRYYRFSLNRSRDRSRNTHHVTDKIVQLARSVDRIGKRSRWEIFLSAIRAIDRWEELSLPNRDKPAEPLALESLPRASEQRLLERLSSVHIDKEPIRVLDGSSYPLSSGEISFLRFAAQASLHIDNGSLLLLDEPETHLHPNFVSQFAALLDRLLDQTGSAAIIATHSAYFVREVFQSQVLVLRQDATGRVSSERPRLRTFGADVGAISHFVFGEDEPSRMASDVERRLKTAFNTWQELYDVYKDELSHEMLGALRDAMET
ncbi:ATP-binding protein [Cupriavidus pinatubonensis]|uniref:AAA family ATPase n=1 Tax=Cupriavidus pinatubonensis TaxID=248026 RepID=UPI001C72E77A|nr:AAA family ATPase [Cupriavidus pinatubonensis]QYY30861.1 ATP-binding protein [Cupriavidus pinatubonensis]